MEDEMNVGFVVRIYMHWGDFTIRNLGAHACLFFTKVEKSETERDEEILRFFLAFEFTNKKQLLRQLWLFCLGNLEGALLRHTLIKK